MIVGIIIIELFFSLLVAVVVALGNPGSDLGIAPLGTWFACSILQLAIHYRPDGSLVRNGLVLVMMLMVLAGIEFEGVKGAPFLSQGLFIAAIASLPQLLVEWSSKATTDRHLLWLCLVSLLSLPFGLTAWSIANIGIVKFEARLAAQGEPYCVLVSNGKLFSSGYHKVPDDWGLSGWRMISGRGGGGSGDCCQWDFHALLLTQTDKLFNWSYHSQRFEAVSEQSRILLHLDHLGCL